MNRRTAAGLALTAALALGAAACSSSSTPTTTAAGGSSAPPTSATTMAPGTTMHGAMGTTPTAAPASTAVGLREALTLLLDEHVILATRATGAALGGRTDEMQAAVAQLDRNSDAIAEAIGSVYGADAGKAFAPLWKKHIGFVVDYTKALGAGDQAGAQQQVDKLLAYADELGAFLNAANPKLPKDTVSQLVKTHITSLKAVIDAQAAKDPVKAYEALGTAVDHMHEIADPLAAAIAAQHPDQLTGDPMSKAADLQVALSSLLTQHVAYAAAVTDAALGGRTGEVDAAKALLARNTAALSDAVGSVFGASAGKAFSASWEKHIGFFVDYTTATGAHDDAARKVAADNLDRYAGELAAFFSSALPSLPKATVQELVKGHITGLEGVIDAQAAKQWPAAYQGLHEGMAHMREIADPLAAAIVAEKGAALGG